MPDMLDYYEEVLLLRKQVEKYETILKHAMSEKSGVFFICGEAGEKDTSGLPDKVFICPTHELDYRDNKCIVHGCSNHADQGRFVGEMCSPCHTMITTGKVMPTDSFLNQITSLEADNEKLKNILRKAFPEKSGHYFICGEAGEKDGMGLPEKIMVCPAYGLDGFASYKKDRDYDSPGW